MYYEVQHSAVKIEMTGYTTTGEISSQSLLCMGGTGDPISQPFRLAARYSFSGDLAAGVDEEAVCPSGGQERRMALLKPSVHTCSSHG